MGLKPGLGLLLGILLNLGLSSATLQMSSPSPHYEPMVAMLCPGKGERFKPMQNKFMTKTGKWETDYGTKATCKTSKIEVLEYCKQVYPDMTIDNVVESSKYQSIDKWCKSGNLKCKGPARWVKPFRCIESPPTKPTASTTPSTLKTTDNEYYDDDYLEEEDDEYYDDDEYDDDEDDDDDDDDVNTDELLNEIETEEKNKKAEKLKLDSVDPYFTHYSPSEEHKEFSRALERLDGKHRDRMTKVMKEWSRIEDKYSSLAKTSKEDAETLNHEMTKQFEDRIEGLEKDHEGEKDQIISMHQQRVVSRINQRKEDAMKCYTTSLNSQPVSYPTVRDCLEKLLRALHKDRHHSLEHYRNMVELTPDQADRQKEVTLMHLTDIDRIVNESLGLLDRFPDLRIKLLPLMEDFLIELRSKDDTPAPRFSMDRKQEEKILDSFKDNVVNRIQEQEEKMKEEKKKRKEKKKMEDTEKMVGDKEKILDEENMREEKNMLVRRRKIDLPVVPGFNTGAKRDEYSRWDDRLMDEYSRMDEYSALNKVEVEVEDRVVNSNAQAHKLIHDQLDFSVSTSTPATGDGYLHYILLVGGGAAIIVLLGLVVFKRRRNNNIRSHQGFLEVPQFSCPEEKHLSSMQASGYENPTYKYFEASVA